jgi:thymidylate synthase (FAD)
VTDPAPQSTPAGLSEVRFRSDVSVELVKSSAADADVLFAARVSTAGEKSLDLVGSDPGRSAGLINFLMRDRHGCYDDRTEVLTRSGWKRWPDVDGTEEFLTRAADGRLEYHRSERVIAKPYHGPMVRVRGPRVDLSVTPDHRMLAKRRGSGLERYELVPASDLLDAPHRLMVGAGRWEPEAAPAASGHAGLLGFFLGRGHLVEGTRIEFDARRSQQIAYLAERAQRAGFEVRPSVGGRCVVEADEEFRRLVKQCFSETGAKIVPGEVLDWRADDLCDVLDGMVAANDSPDGRRGSSVSTTSATLAGQVQEVCVKAGAAAVVYAPRPGNDGGPGGRALYTVRIHGSHESETQVGRTAAERAEQVVLEEYTGTVHCVTVPNGTLYVRRDGKPLWCGNSPFEHNSFTFFVSAPIFVFREFMRHRMFSFNEESGRYRRLEPVFYVPGADRKLVQEGKPGRYVFTDGTPEQHTLVQETARNACTTAYRAYLDLLEAGIAREVARGVLPVSIYSSLYATCNARALMHFLSLRTKREDSTFPSFPQREIEMVAEKMEAAFAVAMPLTHAAFNRNGRVAP